MVVFAGAAIVLYGLFNTNLIALGRAHDVSRQMSAAHHAVEYLTGINPYEEQAGEMRVNEIDVVWSARLLEPVRQSQTVAGERGYFEVGLYEIVFESRGLVILLYRSRSRRGTGGGEKGSRQAVPV